MGRDDAVREEERVALAPRVGAEPFMGDLPLDRERRQIVVDASALAACHPMFAVRLRLFIDWHLAAGHSVQLIVPQAPDVAQHFADIGVADGLPEGVVGELPDRQSTSAALFAVRRLRTPHDVEDASYAAMNVLGQQALALALWGEPVHMAVSELCDNALQHGKNALGTYVAADRTDDGTGRFRLAVADLGIGIPEHIRTRHPEWQDDTAAIVRALQRGVTGTGDPHRGNGFAEVVDDVSRALVRAKSSVRIEIRSARGGVVLDLVDGRVESRPARVDRARRGTWIAYTVQTIGRG